MEFTEQTIYEANEEGIVPTIEFGFDLTQFGGDYDYGKNNYPTCHIPVNFLETVDQDQTVTGDKDEEAFERFTGVDRAHMLYCNPEEDEAYGEEQTQENLEEQEEVLAAIREEHYETCSVCQRTKYTHYGKQ